MARKRVDARLAHEVRLRARDACEFCLMPQKNQRVGFAIDHIVACQHGGATISENLAFCCLHRNLYKGTNLTGLDPATGRLTELFNPRRQLWRDHFELRGPMIVGRTEFGRTTVALLNMNDPDYVKLRQSLIREGFFLQNS